jgi:hypothetical protein
VLVPQTRQLEDDISRDFVSAQAHLEAGKAKLEKANTDHNVALVGDARTEFLAAKADFSKARSRLDSNPLLFVGTYLPIASTYVAPRTRTVQGLTDMGLALSQAALLGADVDALFLKPDGQGAGAAKLLNVLKEAEPKLRAFKADLEKARQALAMVDPAVLPAAQREAVTKAAATVAKGVASIDQVTSLVPALIEILGGNGPRTYLIEQVNPAELRAGGGFIGTYSLMSADAGELKLVKSGDIGDIDYPRPLQGQDGYTPPPPPLLEFIGTKSWVLGDSNFYPDFPTNAKWGETFAFKELKVKPDGVISIDPYVIADLLQITGPIQVPDYDVTVQSKGFVQDLFYREAGANRQSDRKAFLGVVAVEIVAKIATLPPDKWSVLLQTLNNDAASRHLQAYFNHSGAESQINTYGWSGQLNPAGAHDYLYEVESNFGATKANFFVDRKYQVDLSVAGDKLHHHVLVNLQDSTPGGLNGGRLYRYYVRFYVLDAAAGLKIGDVFGDKNPLTEIPAGMKMADGWWQINIDPRTGVGRSQITFDYDTPWTAAGRRYEASGDLGQDRVITLTPSGVTLTPGQAGTAKLPSLSF